MKRLTIRNSDGSVSQPTNLDWSEALYKLASYEDKEEKELLTFFPCTVGDKVAIVEENDTDISVVECTVTKIFNEGKGWKFVLDYVTEVSKEDFGKTVFTDKNELEYFLLSKSQEK